MVTSDYTYGRDEEIFGEGEPAEYVYEVISGAVRSYKLLSDGRRQIGAFHLPGDVFGLENGSTHRLAAEAVMRQNERHWPWMSALGQNAPSELRIAVSGLPRN